MFAAAVAGLLAAEVLQVVRIGKEAEVITDIRPAIQALEFVPGEPLRLHMVLRLGPGPTAKPSEVIAALNHALGEGGAMAVQRLTRVSLE